MDSFVVVVENNIPDVENQLDKVKTYLDNNKVKLENQGGAKERYYNILRAGYSVLSKVPIQEIKPAVFRVFVGTFNKLVQVVE